MIFQLSYMSRVRGVMRSQQHTAHTHTTDLKPSIAPIEVPSSAPPPLTSSRERAATDNVEGASLLSQEQGAATNGAEAPSFAPAQSTSSRERVTTDDANAPHHCRAIRGRPTAPDNLVIVALRGQPTALRRWDTGNACRLRRRRGGQVIPRGK